MTDNLLFAGLHEVPKYLVYYWVYMVSSMSTQKFRPDVGSSSHGVLIGAEAHVSVVRMSVRIFT